MAANSAGYTIASKAKVCLDLFFDCLELLKVSNNVQHWTSLLDQLGRFQIWSSNIGVFADLHASLDYRLREVSDIRDLILQLLTSIDDCLQQLQEDCQVEPPASASNAEVARDLNITEDDFDEVNNGIQESIDWLHRLSNSIRKASSLGQNERAKKFRLTDPDDPTSEDLSPQWKALYSGTIKKEFPALAENLRLRLAESIVLRRKRIMYRQSRNQRWAIQQESYLHKAPEKIDIPQIAPKVTFVVPQKSQEVKPLAQRMYAHSQLTATTLQPERLKKPKAHSVISSALTTPLRKQDQNLIPPLPRAAKSGKDFVCDYCCIILKCIEGLNAQRWSQHVQKDLDPYVCLFDPCDASLELYPTSKEWLEHMRTEHAMRWHCVSRDHDPAIFLSQEEFKTHMRTSHPGKFEDDILDYIAASSARPMENVFNNDCPFCGESPENMIVHIGDHLKYLALYTLPCFEEEDDGDTNNSSKLSNSVLKKSRTTIERPMFPVEELMHDHSDFSVITSDAETVVFDLSIPDEEVPDQYLKALGNRLGNWYGILPAGQEPKQLHSDDIARDKILSSLYEAGAWHSHIQRSWHQLYLIVKVRNILIRSIRQKRIKQCKMFEIQSAVNNVVFSPNGKKLALGLDNYCVQVWDIATGEIEQTLLGHKMRVWSVAFSPDGSKLVSGSEDKTIRVWDVATEQTEQTLKGHSDFVKSVIFSPDGSKLASGSDDKTIRVWDVATGQIEQTLEGHLKNVKSVVFSPDGSKLASGSRDENVRVWDVATGLTEKTLKGHSDWVRSVVFSPDGSKLASASDDNTIRVWDITTRQAEVLKGHLEYVYSVAFSPDGGHLASGAGDKTVRVWDLVTGQFESLKGHSNYVSTVAFSPDGSMLASGSDDETVLIWDVPTWRR